MKYTRDLRKTLMVSLTKIKVKQMSYIERIRECGRDANPFFCLMGINVDSLDMGKAVLSMRVRDDMLNGEGYLQGGMFTALADEAMVLAIYSLLEARPGYCHHIGNNQFHEGGRTRDGPGCRGPCY